MARTISLIAGAARIPRPVAASLLVNAGLPVLLYVLLSPHMSTLHAVMLITLVPLAEGVIGFVRRRRVDAFGMFVLSTLVLGAGIVLLGGSARLILAREQLVTGVIGLALLASLLLPRPGLFYLFRATRARGEAARSAEFDARWDLSAPFREFLRLVTLVFGLAIVAEAAVNIYLAYAVSVPTFLAISPLVRYGIAGGLLLWFVLAVRRFKQVTGQHPFRAALTGVNRCGRSRRGAAESAPPRCA